MDQATFQQAQQLYSGGYFQQASQIIENILRSKPDDFDALHLSGAIAHKQGNHDLAVRRFISALALKQDAAIHNNLALVLLSQGDYMDAKKHFSRAIVFQPDVPDFHLHLGVSYYSLNKIEKAIKSYQQALQLKPDYIAALKNLGTAYNVTGEYGKALECYEKVLALNPEESEIYFNQAIVYKNQKNLDAAMTNYQRCLELNPEFDKAHYNLARIHESQGDLEKSIEHVLLALKITPDYTEATYYLGVLLKTRGDLDSSILHFQQAIKLLVHNPLPAPPAKAPISTSKARKTLLSAHEILGKQGITFFPSSGTLLGIIRDNDILPHDKDLDIGLLWDVDRDQVIDCLCKNNLFELNDKETITPDHKQWFLSFTHVKNQIALDLFFYKPSGNHFLYGFHHLPHPILSRPRIFELANHEWNGRIWQVPENPDQYLTDLYGAEWKKPDKLFDTVISHRSQTPESRDGRRCYGYSRLYNQIKNRNWAKALGYCDQLQRLKPEKFLEDLSIWLERQ